MFDAQEKTQDVVVSESYVVDYETTEDREETYIEDSGQDISLLAYGME